jgi:hypothetical protein
MRDNKVVFPAPEAPIIASISPGLQYPEQGDNILLSSIWAANFFQVIVIYSVISI